MKTSLFIIKIFYLIMEDFNLNFDNEIGSSVSQLKERRNNNLKTNEVDNFGDTDIDYDTIMNNLKHSETFNDTQSQLKQMKPKKQLNVSNMEKSLQFDLNNIPNLDEPLPINFTNKMINKESKELPKNNPMDIIQKTKPTEVIKKEPNTFLNWEYADILLYGLLFILLNNLFSISLINKIPKVIEYNRFQINLIIRTIIFSAGVFLIKKYSV